MRMNILPNMMLFEGVLDENTSLNELNEAFNKLKAAGATAPVTLDLSKVSRANSSGILTWLRFLKNAQFQFKYINTPAWLVSQFNIITGYFENGSYVESFQAPFYAPKSRSSKNLILVVNKDIQIESDYSSFSMPNKTIDGEEYEIDFDPSQYFHFLEENCENFKKVKI